MVHSSKGAIIDLRHYLPEENVLISSPPEFATAIHDLILKPPGENPYNPFKEQLIQ